MPKRNICRMMSLTNKKTNTYAHTHTPCIGVISNSPTALADPDTEKSKATLPVLCTVSSSSLLLVKITCLKSSTLRSSRNPTVEDSPERVQRYSGPPVTTHTAADTGVIVVVVMVGGRRGCEGREERRGLGELRGKGNVGK